MRILFIHTFYQQKGGEDSVFYQEKDLMSQSNQVETVLFHNQSGFKGALQFFVSIWNFRAASKVKKAIRQFKPQVVHLHNFHFGAGPLVIRTIRKAGIPVVVTLHNYRLICPSATLFFKDRLFLDSIHASFPWKAVRAGVYRDSVLQTFWLAFTNWFHKKTGTWNMVDNFIVLTEFAKNQFLNSSLGVGEHKFVVKSNFLSQELLNAKPRMQHFLFIGRLTAEKGIPVLLDAFKNSPHKLRIIGTGPLTGIVKKAAEENANIELYGQLSRDEVFNELAICSALIFPSLWYEGMPMTILESFAAGTPVIASNFGAMATIITNGVNGLHFNPHDTGSLINKLNYWWALPLLEKNTYCDNTRRSFDQNFTAEKNRIIFEGIYYGLINKI